MTETTSKKSENYENAQGILSRILQISYDRVLKEQCRPEDTEEGKINLIKHNAREKSIDVVGINDNDFHELIDVTELKADGSAEKFSVLLAQVVARYFLSLYTLQEIELKMRTNTIERHGYTEIGRILCCEFTDAETIALHATPTFFSDPKDFKDVFFNDLKVLADKLQHDDAFRGVTKIAAVSQLVTRLKLTLSKIGFTNFLLDTNTNVTSAEVETTTFIRELKKNT